VFFKNQIPGIKEKVCGEKIFPAENRDWNDFTKQILFAAEASSFTPEIFFNYYGWNRIVETVTQVIDQL